MEAAHGSKRCLIGGCREFSGLFAKRFASIFGVNHSICRFSAACRTSSAAIARSFSIELNPRAGSARRTPPIRRRSWRFRIAAERCDVVAQPPQGRHPVQKAVIARRVVPRLFGLLRPLPHDRRLGHPEIEIQAVFAWPHVVEDHVRVDSPLHAARAVIDGFPDARPGRSGLRRAPAQGPHRRRGKGNALERAPLVVRAHHAFHHAVCGPRLHRP